MKKRKFNSRAMKEFTEPKVVHESNRVDLITQYNRMRSIAADIYNSDFYTIATKAEQKKIETSIACISATMISMIGMEAIKNSHDCLPDDSGNGDDRSWDNLPDDSGNGEVEFEYTPYKSRYINDLATSNRKNLGELGAKSPVDVLDEDPSAFGNEYDDTDDDSNGDEVKDYSEVNLGNFADGPFYAQQYLDICKRYGFDIEPTLKQIEKLASYYYIQMINLVDVVNSQDEITDDKYTLEPGSVFFITNKNDSSKSPVFVLIYTQPYTKTKSSDISRFSLEIAPEHTEKSSSEDSTSEETTNSDDIEFIGIDAYFNIEKVHLNQNEIVDLDATLIKIKKEAKLHDIKTITFVDTIGNSLDIYSGKYSLESGYIFCHKGNGWMNFMLIIKDEDTSDKVHVRFIEPIGKPEESTESEDDIKFIGIDAYYNIDKAYPNPDRVIDLDATLIRIKEKAKKKGIKTITFVDTIKEHSDLYTNGKYSLDPGSLFFVKEGYLRFILINKTSTTFHYIDPVVVFKTDDSEDESDSKEDDIEFVSADYYNIDKACPNSTIIDLDATLTKIKERARAKNIKTITFVGIIKGFYDIFYKCKYYQAGSLLYIKNDERPRFVLITGTIDYVNLPQYEHIDPVVVFKTDDSEDESDSKEDGIEAVEAEDEIVDSDEASSDHCINDQYADVDTSELHPDIYTKVSFPIFMRPIESGKNISFADICDIYDFDVSETIKRIKNAAYQENIEDIRYVDTIYSRDEIFRKDENDRYVYGNGSLFLMVNYTNAGKDPFFVILRKLWDDPDFDAILYRINPIMRPAKIHGIKKIDIIDTYADGDVRIANDLKNFIDIDHSYKLKEVCDKRNYDYDRISSCLKGVTAIIGGGTRLTFEGTVRSINSIILVDPVVAYNTCSVFFVRDFVEDEEPYFAIYMPITGKTKNGYNFRLYRINPIPNLNQDPNTDSQDDSNARKINQFTSIYRANWEVSEADKEAYMKVVFSLVNHNDGGIHSFPNICYTWKFKFYDTIKRIRLVAYMYNFKEIKYDGTACSHEEILEKEVLYNNGSVLFVCDVEDPHFVIVRLVDGYTCLNRINPVKE